MKSGSPHQPVMILVQRVENLRVGQELIETLARIQPRVVGQVEFGPNYGAKWLDLGALLAQPRLTACRDSSGDGFQRVLFHVNCSMRAHTKLGFATTGRFCGPLHRHSGLGAKYTRAPEQRLMPSAVVWWMLQHIQSVRGLFVEARQFQ